MEQLVYDIPVKSLKIIPTVATVEVAEYTQTVRDGQERYQQSKTCLSVIQGLPFCTRTTILSILTIS